MPEKVRPGPVMEWRARSRAGVGTWSTPTFRCHTAQRGDLARARHMVPEPQNGGSRGSVAFAEGGEMLFSQQWFSLTH